MSVPPLLRAQAITLRYGGADPVLDALDLELVAGERVAVLGRSGSGKSSLLNLLGAMARPSAGTLEFNGLDMAAWSEAERTAFRRAHLGFVFQAYNLLPSLTVAENVALPLELNARCDPERVAELLAALDIAALAERFPDQLSGGEQQRTAIARAVVHRPALILADEPTGNLDRDSGLAVITLFEQAVKDSGAALVMATHSLDMVGHASRVLRIESGRLVRA